MIIFADFYRKITRKKSFYIKIDVKFSKIAVFFLNKIVLLQNKTRIFKNL